MEKCEKKCDWEGEHLVKPKYNLKTRFQMDIF